jgi:hypothetical protein
MALWNVHWIDGYFEAGMVIIAGGKLCQWKCIAMMLVE